jgi:hypothetical protein
MKRILKYGICFMMNTVKMNRYLLLIVILITTISYAQLKPLKDADLLTKEVTKNTSFKVDKFEFKIDWQDKLSHSPNLGYLGGIKSLKIYSKGRLINDFISIEDEVGLQKFIIEFYDFNLDGTIDFRIRRECGGRCYYSYYLSNIQTNKFENPKEWDYIRVRALDFKNKLLADQLAGINEGADIYKVKGNRLIKQLVKK